jgi:hypothetical protein
MKYTYLALAFAAFASANAATIIDADPAAGGIGYAWTAQIGVNESITTPNIGDSSVGVWSWNDTAFAGAPNMGWTHTTSWLALEVTESLILTVTMGRNESVPYLEGFRDTQYLFPSFTMWKGWDNSGGDDHIYANDGLVSWAEGLTELIGRVDNNTEETATLKILLEPGLYTLALGSQGPATGGLPRQGFYTSFTTIPEPSSAVLGSAAIGLLAFRRRR